MGYKWFLRRRDNAWIKIPMRGGEVIERQGNRRKRSLLFRLVKWIFIGGGSYGEGKGSSN